MTDPLDAMKARWSHIQSFLFPWLHEEIEPMIETLGRLVAILDVIGLEAVVPGMPRGAGQPAEDRRALAAGAEPHNKRGRQKKDQERSKERPKPEQTRLERQVTQNVGQMLAAGAKKDSKGYKETWIGYKLHIDVACGQIPVSCVLTSASVHDSRVAIPLMTMTSVRVFYLYDLMDAAYDAAAIALQSKALGHVSLIGRTFRGQSTLKATERTWL